jgi:hypothetical protein
MPKEIKITTKRIIKKTNILKNNLNQNVISTQNQINLEGTQIKDIPKKDEIMNIEKFDVNIEGVKGTTKIE